MLRVAPYQASDLTRWDELVGRSANGTLMHTRRFLSYHRDRFVDRSLTVHLDDRLVAVFPAALEPDDPSVITSHPGLSYGGLVYEPSLAAPWVVAAIECIAEHFAGEARTLRYKLVPSIYHRRPASEDSYALFRLGAARHRVDLSATIDLGHPRRANENRRRGLKKAITAGLRTSIDPVHLPAYWRVLESVLTDIHGVRPTHTASEFAELVQLFPDDIVLRTALLGDEVVAGVATLLTERAVHAQYIASSDVGRALGGLDLVFEEATVAAAARGARWFDFGHSNEEQGRVLNASLHAFKVSFGAGATVQEHFELRLG